MNILVIPSWYENMNNLTLGSFFREQAESLANRGHNVYVLYVDIIRFNEINRMVKTSKIHTYKKNGLSIYRIKKIKMPKIKEKYVYNMVKNGIEDLYLKFIFNKVKIDVMHAHSFIWGGSAGVDLGKKYDIPVMVTEHYTGYSRNLFTEDEKEIITRTINCADKVIAVSTGLRNDLLKYTQKSIDIIPNMVDNDLFNLSNSSYNESKSKFIFLSVCYLMYKKGIDILLRAFSQAFKQDETAELIIAGDGEEKKNLLKICNDLNIEDKVKFIGAIDRKEVAKQMRLCNCFVLPSRHETFGVVYIEALAAGKPIIGTDTDAIFDIVDCSNGIVVKKESVDELAKAMIYIKNNYRNYNQKKISESCIEKFGKQSIARRIESNLLEVVEIKNNSD